MERTNKLISCTTIDEYITKAEIYLMRKYGVDRAEIDIYPLKWYIFTGRASAAWTRTLLETIPYNAAKILHKGGSVEEVICRINNYIGWKIERDL